MTKVSLRSSKRKIKNVASLNFKPLLAQWDIRWWRLMLSPKFLERGGCANKKMPRSDLSGADGVVNHKLCRKSAFRNMARGSPPRPLPLRWLRDILLRSRPPLSRNLGLSMSRHQRISHCASKGLKFSEATFLIFRFELRKDTFVIGGPGGHQVIKDAGQFVGRVF